MGRFRKAACVVLLRKNKLPDEEGYEFFLVKRNPELKFMGGFHVFPGGTVDPEDATIPLRDCPNSDFRIAAARELFEETGILAAHGPAFPDTTTLKHLRQQLLSKSISFQSILDNHQLTLDGRDFLEFGQWITPQFSPVRFDALYFGVLLPQNQE